MERAIEKLYEKYSELEFVLMAFAKDDPKTQGELEMLQQVLADLKPIIE